MDKTKSFKHKFPNGSEFTGTLDELSKVAIALKQPLIGIEDLPRGYYTSSTDGIVKISNMHSFHIRRALLKATNDYMKKVFDAEDTNTKFIEKYAGIINDTLIQDFLNELVARGEEMVGKEEPKAGKAAKESKKK